MAGNLARRAGVAILLIIVAVLASHEEASVALAQPLGGAKGQAATTRPGSDSKALVRAAEEWVRNNPKGKTGASEKRAVKNDESAWLKRDEREAMGYRRRCG